MTVTTIPARSYFHQVSQSFLLHVMLHMWLHICPSIIFPSSFSNYHLSCYDYEYDPQLSYFFQGWQSFLRCYHGCCLLPLRCYHVCIHKKRSMHISVPSQWCACDINLSVSFRIWEYVCTWQLRQHLECIITISIDGFIPQWNAVVSDRGLIVQY